MITKSLKDVILNAKIYSFLLTCIPDPSSDDSFGTSKLGLGKPKSGHPKSGLFGGHVRIR